MPESHDHTPGLMAKSHELEFQLFLNGFVNSRHSALDTQRNYVLTDYMRQLISMEGSRCIMPFPNRGRKLLAKMATGGW